MGNCFGNAGSRVREHLVYPEIGSFKPAATDDQKNLDHRREWKSVDASAKKNADPSSLLMLPTRNKRNRCGRAVCRIKVTIPASKFADLMLSQRNCSGATREEVLASFLIEKLAASDASRLRFDGFDHATSNSWRPSLEGILEEE